MRLDFPIGFSGPLDIYAVDVDTSTRRQTVTVDDGSGPVTRAITTAFSPGAWLHYTINVPAGGSVSIVAARTAGANAVISGIFLGPAGPPANGGPAPTPTPTPTGPPPPIDQPGAQGDWVGAYGSAGYVLGAWNGTSDLAVLPGASLTLLQGDRFLYGPNGEARSVENATETERRQAVVWDDVQVRLRLDFPSGFSGPLDVYAVDYDTTGRRQTVTVDDGSGPVSRAITTSFSQGAWIHYTVNVAPGGSVSIVAARTAGANAVISGVFLVRPGHPPVAAPVPPRHRRLRRRLRRHLPRRRPDTGPDADTHAGRRHRPHADADADADTCRRPRRPTPVADAHTPTPVATPTPTPVRDADTDAGRADADTDAQPDAESDDRPARRAGRLGRRLRVARASPGGLEQLVGPGLTDGRDADTGPGFPSSMVRERHAGACARERGADAASRRGVLPRLRGQGPDRFHHGIHGAPARVCARLGHDRPPADRVGDLRYRDQTVALTSAFGQGAWVHFHVSAAAGTSCTVSATRTAGANAVISGIFLGG